MLPVARHFKSGLFAKRRSARVITEALENRTLLSASLTGTTLNITGTSAADVFTLSDNSTTITVKQGASSSTFADSAVTKIVVNPTAGGDSITVQSNTKPIAITGGGLDTVNIGAGSMINIKGAITIANPTSFTALNVDDSVFQGLSYDPPPGSLSQTQINMVPAVINFNAAQLSSLSITTWNYFDIDDSPVLHNNVPTQISGGLTGLFGTTGPVTINPTESEAIQFGDSLNGTLSALHGPVVVNSPKNIFIYVNISDPGDIADTNVLLSPAPDAVVVTGISPAPITVNGISNQPQLLVNTGSGNDTITIDADSPTATIIDSGPGNDTIIDNGGGAKTSIYGNDGDDTFIYNDSTAAPNFDGGSGINNITVDKSSDTLASNFTLTGNTVTHSGPAVSQPSHFTYTPSTISQINFLLGSGNDTVIADSSVTTALEIHGGAGNDSLQGGAGNDSIFGDAGNDTLRGGAGNDSLTGGAGTDVLTGGTGIDTLFSDLADGPNIPAVQIIADNIANVPVSGSQGVFQIGNWTSSTSSAAFYGSNYFTDNNTLKDGKSFTWIPNLPAGGAYEVFAQWPAAANRATNVPFDILHQGVKTTVTENQRTNNNTWVSFGVYSFDAGTSSSITVRNTGTNGYVIADAVRFVPLSTTLSIHDGTLNVYGTSNADTITLSDDATFTTVEINGVASTFPDVAVSKIIVNPTPGGDTVDVLSNTKPISIIGGGPDTVNITSAGSLLQLAAPINVTNPLNFTALNIDGSAELDGLAMTGTTVSLPNTTVTYTAAQLSALNINSPGSVTVYGTGILHANVPTVVTGGDVTVVGTTGPLTINPGDTRTVNLGGGNMQSIKGAVYIDNDDVYRLNLTINDSTDTVGRIASLTGFAPSLITGFSPATITLSRVGAMGYLTVYGGLGNDSIYLGFASGDVHAEVHGGAGNDTLYGDSSELNDSFYGDAGDDTFVFNENSSFPTFDGGSGINTAEFDQSQADYPSDIDVGETGMVDTYQRTDWLGHFSFDPTTVQKLGVLLGNSNDGVEIEAGVTIPVFVHGGGGDDTVISHSAVGDSLYGDAGNDSIYGGAGNDVIDGGDGDDLLVGGPGADSLYGGAGNDSLSGGPGTDLLSGGTGIDSLDAGDGTPVQIIADNIANIPSNGSQGVTVNGNWIASTSNSGFYGSNYLTDNNSLKGTKSVKFAPNLPFTGSYQVYARWTAASNRASRVPFNISHQGVNTTVFENQQANNNTWILLGTYTFNAGTGSSVMVSNAGTTGYVIADAVRFVPTFSGYSISGSVFNDSNGNGILDPGEGGVADRSIYLDLNKDGVEEANEPQMLTDSSGNYTIKGLPPGTYRVREQNLYPVQHTFPSPGANFYDVTITNASVTGKIFGDETLTGTFQAISINVGGPTFTLNSGMTYFADTDFTGGVATNIPFEVVGTDNDPVYYSYRSGKTITYNLSMPTYQTFNPTVVLNFVDPTSTAAGQRKFNVTLQGQQVLTNFDIYASGGSKTAVSKSFKTSVTDGALTLTLDGVVGDAILSGIVVYWS